MSHALSHLLKKHSKKIIIYNKKEEAVKEIAIGIGKVRR